MRSASTFAQSFASNKKHSIFNPKPLTKTTADLTTTVKLLQAEVNLIELKQV